jgi:amylosucrase
LFEGIRKMIAVRKNTPAFADFNNRELIYTGNPHLFVFLRSDPFGEGEPVLVVANFHDAPESLDLGDLRNRAYLGFERLRDLNTGEAPSLFNEQLVIPPYRFYWLSSR